MQRAAKLNPAYEPDPITAQYYRRLDDNTPKYFLHDGQRAQYSSPVFSDGFKELSNEEMHLIYQNSSLSEEVGNSQKSIISIEVGFDVPLRCLGLNKGIAWDHN